MESFCPAALGSVAGQGFMGFINTLMVAQCALVTDEIYPSDYGASLKDGEEFDFIVVGSGSAGSLLASRLSENPNWKVLLIEAGSYPSMTTEIPQFFPVTFRTSEDWTYRSKPTQNACRSLNNKQCYLARGKTLGGSGAINAMYYIRGNRHDYDRWVAAGNDGWDYDTVIPYYKKFEGLQGVDDENIGKDGEFKLAKYINDQPLRDIFIDAYNEVGYGEYSEEQPRGYTDVYTNIHKGTRYSTAKAFLPVMKKRENAFVVLNAQVSKVLLTSDLTATGVEMRLNDKIITVKASKEVILSAGVINSPQILMNSGIGPKEHLEEIGIPVLKDLKVGENLQDHMVFTGLLVNVNQEVIPEASPTEFMDNFYEYVMYRKGLFSKTAENFIFFMNSKNNSNYPTLETYFATIAKNDPMRIEGWEKIFSWTKEVVKTVEENNKKHSSFLILPSVSYPKSVGKVLLNSNDPFDKPIVDTNYLSDEDGEDLQVFVEGVQFYEKLIKTKAFAKYNPEIVKHDLENCKEFADGTSDYWKCVIRNLATTGYHQAGTCRMGPENDPRTVVDPRLHVHGIKRLRVADASVIPEMISCNIHAPTIMIAQRVSQMIKEDWTSSHTEL